jgi:hypothetical protein
MIHIELVSTQHICPSYPKKVANTASATSTQICSPLSGLFSGAAAAIEVTFRKNGLDEDRPTAILTGD